MNQKINYKKVIKVKDSGLAGKKPDISLFSGIVSQRRNKIDQIIIPKFHLKKRIRALAEEICKDYKKTNEINLVTILKGAFIFASDLGREIYNISGLKGPEIHFDFIKAVTYGDEIKHSEEPERNVTIELKPKNLQGKNVLLIEDIVDQGFTLFEIQKILLAEEKLQSLRTCVLLSKILKNPSKKVRELKNKLVIDYLGFEIPDRWIAGYGIDAGDDFRHLPFVLTVKEDYYLNKK